MRQWKLSSTDLESISRWEDYSRAKDEMMVHTDTPSQPVVRRRVRHQEARPAEHDRPPALQHPVRGRAEPEVELPDRLTSTTDYRRPPREMTTYVPDYVAELMGDIEAER